MSMQTIKFYQTGTFTVGNRLLSPQDRTVQANMQRTNSLNSGHRACQGCGEALGARYAIDAAMNATNRQLIAANATGCLEVFSTLSGNVVADSVDPFVVWQCARRCLGNRRGDQGQARQGPVGGRARRGAGR